MKTASRAVYWDSSALIKVVTVEAESEIVRGQLSRHRHAVTSALAHTEVIRMARTKGVERAARRVLERWTLLRIGPQVLEDAALLRPDGLRSLDAIHLASARTLGHSLSHVVTYDKRMAEAAEGMGLKVRAPA